MDDCINTFIRVTSSLHPPPLPCCSSYDLGKRLVHMTTLQRMSVPVFLCAIFPLCCMYNAPFVPECQHTLTHKHMWLQHKCEHIRTDRAPLYRQSIDRVKLTPLSVFGCGLLLGHLGKQGCVSKALVHQMQ